MKRFLLVMVLVGITILQFQPAVAQPNSFAFGQLESLQKAERRPVVVFISTDWCRYCSRMKLSTFRDEQVVKLLNTSFYFVFLNAEEKNDISFHGHTFRYRPTGNGTGVHELAEQLGSVDGRLSYPTLSVLNAEMEIIYQHGGYLSAKELSTLLALVKKEQQK
ncbi:thioredoxin family protein [Pontibacter pamirensis]|uniref:thioredoxin family protein n=1 Tax=Pontibacter pamirensis TaxID=2562824 RepID=UPI00138A2D91|nr:thioredoxin family protein [Pontibacter pamirensis]